MGGWWWAVGAVIGGAALTVCASPFMGGAAFTGSENQCFSSTRPVRVARSPFFAALRTASTACGAQPSALSALHAQGGEALACGEAGGAGRRRRRWHSMLTGATLHLLWLYLL